MIENPYINPPEEIRNFYLEELMDGLESEKKWLENHLSKLEVLEAYRVDVEALVQDLRHTNAYLHEHDVKVTKETDALDVLDYTIDKLKGLIEDKKEDIKDMERLIEEVKENGNVHTRAW